MTAKRTKTVELNPSTPSGSRASALVKSLGNNALSYTAGDISSQLRWIDFLNPKYSCPCIAMEWFFGARGLLAGRVLQLRAKYSKGKSSFMYYMYAAAQRTSDAFCFHVETEGAIAPADFIWSFGCDPDNLAVAEHNSLEECFTNLDEVIASIRGGFDGQKGATGRWSKTKFTAPLDKEMKVPIIIGVDSFSALGLDEQVREDVADMTSTPGLAQHARKVRDYMRRRTQRWKQNQALVMLTSHETSSINTGPAAFGGGVKKSALAQEAIGIHATYIVDVNSRPWKDKATGDRIGDIITMVTEKNKLSPRGRSIELYLRWNHGFDMIKTDAEFLMKHSASPFSATSTRHGHGISCPLIGGNNSFKTDEDLIEAFYGNIDLLQTTRENMRIRGHGFDFELNYKLSQAEILDNADEKECE